MCPDNLVIYPSSSYVSVLKDFLDRVILEFKSWFGRTSRQALVGLLVDSALRTFQ